METTKQNNFTSHFTLFFFFLNKSIHHISGVLTSLPNLVRTVSVVGPSLLGGDVTGGAGFGVGESSTNGGLSSSTTPLMVRSGTK